MANQVAARLRGDDYQHLFAWWCALELLMPPRRVSVVIIEDAEAGSADDVSILREDGAKAADRYHQIKYHVDQRNSYSAATLMERETNKKSLIQKWFRSWEALVTARPARPIEIHIVSNWGWDSSDDLGRLVGGQDNALKDEFFTADGQQKAGILRAQFLAHVGATPERFVGFARTLRFRFGYDCMREIADRAAERMENLGLKSDETGLLVAVGIVRQWITSRRQDITLEVLKSVITHHTLWLPDNVRAAVNIYLLTIMNQRFDIDPDFVLDWRRYFLSPGPVRGHETIEPADWNGKMLPELRSLQERVNTDMKARLVRARGLARLSAWFAFGFVFSDVARYTIEVDQQGWAWQTDAETSGDFTLTTNDPHGECLATEGETVAVGISITGDLEGDVRRHLKHRSSPVRAVMFVRPTRDLGRNCLRHAGDAVALADGVKEMIRGFVKHHRAARVLLFYLGPLSAACFIGHRLNAVCREIQVMEWCDPEYIPSFTLT